jgi:predicted RNase H-like HicB family nuclease
MPKRLRLLRTPHVKRWASPLGSLVNGEYFIQAPAVRHCSPVRETMAIVSARSRTMELTAVLTHAEEGGFVALNPETGTTTQGETVEEAVANLKEATALYLSEFPMPSMGHPVVTMFTVPEPAHA